MRIGIGVKLFVALLGAGIVMAAAMGLASRISFQQGFLGYLNELEDQRLAALTSALAELYREQGGAGSGWAFLAGRDDEWRRILRSTGRAFRSGREAAERGEAARPGTDRRTAPPGERRAEPGGHGDLRPEFAGRIALLDADRRVLAGNRSPAADAVHRPIVVDGRTVGWVANTPFRELTDAADLAFQRQQTEAAWFIAALAVLLAGATAWVLGRIVLAPARTLAAATHRLAGGHYGTRVPVGSADELGRLGADFNRLADTLERNEKLRREFMADVSHELRTPLAIMRGELEAIEDGLMPFDRRSLQSLQAEVGTLAKLVDDIHTLAVAEVGALRYGRVPVDVGALLRAAVDGFRERAGVCGLAIAVAGPDELLQVDGDPDRLHQVFANVFENAARYCAGSAAAPVPVRIGWRRDGAAVVIDVDDGGAGVAEPARAKLFDRFFREEASRNRATGGSGLGLAICRGIVVAHGGTIEALASPLGGLRIRIRLPLGAAGDAGEGGRRDGVRPAGGDGAAYGQGR